jgi:hypothetical protein
MTRLLIAIFIGSLASQWGALAHAQAWGWSPRDTAIDKYWRAQIRKARADCALKLGITNLPDRTIDLVARYGSDKANVFEDCVRDELGLGAWK